MKIAFLVLIIAFGFSASAQPPMAFYVKTSAPGSDNTGTSWTNAFTDLTFALSSARAGDTIKVASGIYTPWIPRTNTYNLKEGVTLLGGYPASGNPVDADRDFNLYPVTLSGIIPSSNNLHVLTGYDLTAATIVDGFIISGGRAANGPPGAVEKGGALILHNSHPVFKNCVFRDNEALYGGAAAIFSSNPTFTNCIFNNNESALGGAALYAEAGNPVFMNCFFVSNGITNPNTHSIINNTLNTHAIFTNTVFANNTGTVIYNDQSEVNIRFSSLVKNISYPYELGRPSIRGVNNSTINISNSILYFNNMLQANDSSDIYLDASVATVTNSITQAFFNGDPSMKYNDPRFRDTSDIDGPDNLYFTADDGLQLLNPCSPAINAGTPAAGGVASDIMGNPRVFGALPDLGAYELQEAPLQVPQVVYVNKLSTGNNDGSSWADAFTELRTAMQSCSDTIKVAAGTYHPSDSDPRAVFWLENNRVILGGYPASGNPGDAQRDPVANPTILSGNIPASLDGWSVSLIRGRNINNTAVVDGFILQQTNGNSSFNNATYTGAAVHLTSGATPVFKNCVIKDNLSRLGGAIRTYDGSNATFINCTIENNLPAPGSDYGNAVYNLNSSPVFVKCLFTRNKTRFGSIINRHGGAMLNYNSSPVIDSCTFSYNEAAAYGGAIANMDNSNPVISNSTFHANYAGVGANDIYNEHSSPVVSNTMFSDSLLTDYGGSIANKDQSNPVFTRCRFYNGKAFLSGGAVFNDNSFATFNYCVFYRNKGGTGGAISSRNYSKVHLNNCIGVLNSGDGSVLHNRKSEVMIVNSTFAVNNKNTIVNTDSTNLHIQNSIFSNNLVSDSGYPSDIIIGSPAFLPSYTTVTNSLIEGYGTNGVDNNIVGATARFMNHEDPAGPDGVFYTDDDGLQLSRCSPAINAGSNAFSSGLTTDLNGNPRIFGSTVDMGAYEFMGAASGSGTIYVNSGASGSNNGTSWQDAFTDLTIALRTACSDTIKIAGGTYFPVASRDSSFRFNKAKVIWGGYPPSGNPGDAQRDPALWPTVLSGDIGTPNDSTDNNYHVVVINQPDTVIVIDGITVTRGNANGTSPGSNNYHVNIIRSEGGGIYHKNGKVILTNSILSNNTAYNGGAGYLNELGLIEFDRNVFSENNNTGLTGGGYSSRFAIPRNSFITNSVFVNNRSGQNGGAIFLGNPDGIDSTHLRNNLFLNNSSFQGGAIFMRNSGLTSIVNNTFIGNSTFAIGTNPLRQGGAIYVEGTWSSPVYNNIFYKNEHITATTAGADIYNSSCPAFSSCTNFYLRRNILQVFGTLPSAGNLLTPPSFFNENDPDGPDNKWFTSDDGFQLLFNSPGVDHGDNSAIAGTQVDILGNPRINNSIVDLGAFEFTEMPVADAGPDLLVCESSSVQLGSAGSAAYTYNWTSSPAGFTSGDPMPFVSPSVTTSYFLEVSNGIFTSRDTVLVSVLPVVTPSVSVSASATTICVGSNVTFTANPLNEGDAPAYQWKLNGVNTGSDNPVYTNATLANGDIITVTMTSSALCASPLSAIGTPVTMVVNEIVTPAVIISGQTLVVAGTSTFISSTVTGGGSSPLYQWQDSTASHSWQDIPSAVSSGINYAPQADGVKLRSVITSNEVCTSTPVATSNVLTFTLETVIPRVTVYPVPSGDFITIDGLDLTENWNELRIMSIHGSQNIIRRNIQGRNRVTININSLAAGIYTIKLSRHEGDPVTLQFIKL